MPPEALRKSSWKALETDLKKTPVFDLILGWIFIDFISISKTIFEAFHNHSTCLLAKARKQIPSRKPNVLRLKWLLRKITIDTQKTEKRFPRSAKSTSKKRLEKLTVLKRNSLLFWSKNRSKIDTKRDPEFECILTSIFGRFWSIWGSKMKRPAGLLGRFLGGLLGLLGARFIAAAGPPRR